MSFFLPFVQGRTHTRGLVLSKSHIGEADSFITFLTQDWGVVTFLAKSARRSKRRYVGGMDLFCHSEIFTSHKSRGLKTPLLLELKVLNAFLDLRDCLEKLQAAGVVTRWTHKLVEPHAPHKDVYSLLGQTLSLMSQEKDTVRLHNTPFLFLMKLLSILGHAPLLRQCVECHLEEKNVSHFSIPNGGVLCSMCFQKGKTHNSHLIMDINPSHVAILEMFKNISLRGWKEKNRIEGYSSSTLSYAVDMLDTFATFHLDTFVSRTKGIRHTQTDRFGHYLDRSW